MSVPKQGGVLNYLGESEQVKAPRFWKSSPTSPSTELAYITEAEKGLLLDADLHGSLQGSPNKGPSNLLSFDGWGSEDPGQNVAGGDISAGMDSNPDHGGWSDGRGSSTGGGSQFHGSHTPASPPGVTKNPELPPGVDPNKQVKETGFWDGVVDYFKSGGLWGKAFQLGGEVLSKLGEFSSGLQKKAMTYSLNKKLKSEYQKHTFDPFTPDAHVTELENDIKAIENGTFTQNDFNEKYGAPTIDTREGGDNRDFMNYIAPEAPHIVGGTTKQDSVAAKWYASLGNNNNNNAFGFSFQKEYDAAKQKQAGILGSPSSVGMLAVSNSPFYNFLKERNLDKGIL